MGFGPNYDPVPLGELPEFVVYATSLEDESDRVSILKSVAEMVLREQEVLLPEAEVLWEDHGPWGRGAVGRLPNGRSLVAFFNCQWQIHLAQQSDGHILTDEPTPGPWDLLMYQFQMICSEPQGS